MIEKANSQSSMYRIAGLGREIRDYLAVSPLANNFALAKIIPRLNTCVANLIYSLERKKIESQLGQLDAIRDEKGRDFKSLTEGYSHHPDEVMRQYAHTLLNIFAKYGAEIFIKDYLSESSYLDSMFRDYSSPEAVTALAALPGTTESLQALKLAQQEFDSYQLEYHAALGKQRAGNSATANKRKLISVINDELVDFLRSAIRWDTATYQECANTINEMIRKSNSIFKGGSKEDNSPEE